MQTAIVVMALRMKQGELELWTISVAAAITFELVVHDLFILPLVVKLLISKSERIRLRFSRALI